MDKTLYVYTNDRLNGFIEDFNQRTFLGIGFVFNIASNIEDLSELETNHFNDCIIDLTALAFEITTIGFFWSVTFMPRMYL